MLCRWRTTTGKDRLSNTRNAHDNFLLHMQRKVVMGILCPVSAYVPGNHVIPGTRFARGGSTPCAMHPTSLAWRIEDQMRTLVVQFGNGAGAPDDAIWIMPIHVRPTPAVGASKLCWTDKP